MSWSWPSLLLLPSRTLHDLGSIPPAPAGSGNSLFKPLRPALTRRKGLERIHKIFQVVAQSTRWSARLSPPAPADMRQRPLAPLLSRSPRMSNKIVLGWPIERMVGASSLPAPADGRQRPQSLRPAPTRPKGLECIPKIVLHHCPVERMVGASGAASASRWAATASSSRSRPHAPKDAERSPKIVLHHCPVERMFGAGRRLQRQPIGSNSLFKVRRCNFTLVKEAERTPKIFSGHRPVDVLGHPTVVRVIGVDRFAQRSPICVNTLFKTRRVMRTLRIDMERIRKIVLGQRPFNRMFGAGSLAKIFL